MAALPQGLPARIGDLGRGYDFAKHCNDSEVWSVLARAQLDGHHTTEAIDSYIKANDASNFVGTNPRRRLFRPCTMPRARPHCAGPLSLQA